MGETSSAVSPQSASMRQHTSPMTSRTRFTRGSSVHIASAQNTMWKSAPEIQRLGLGRRISSVHSLRGIVLNTSTNDNGRRLINLPQPEQWLPVALIFHVHIFGNTLGHQNGEACSQIYCVLIGSWYFSNVIDVRSFRGSTNDSDHYLVVFKIRARLSNALKSRPGKTVRLNILRLKADGLAVDCASKLDQRIAEQQEVYRIHL